jgi:hypothetical protein
MAQNPIRPGTYLLLIVPHCTRESANALSELISKKNENQYRIIDSKIASSNQRSAPEALAEC